MNVYRIKASSAAAIAALLEAAQAGKPQPFVTYSNGMLRFDAARIVFPTEEMAEGEPVFDDETQETVTPLVLTGDWVCEVRLEEADAELAAIVDDALN